MTDEPLDYFSEEEQEELFDWMDRVFWEDYKGILEEAKARNKAQETHSESRS